MVVFDRQVHLEGVVASAVVVEAGQVVAKVAGDGKRLAQLHILCQAQESAEAVGRGEFRPARAVPFVVDVSTGDGHIAFGNSAAK